METQRNVVWATKEQKKFINSCDGKAQEQISLQVLLGPDTQTMLLGSQLFYSAPQISFFLVLVFLFK